MKCIRFTPRRKDPQRTQSLNPVRCILSLAYNTLKQNDEPGTANGGTAMSIDSLLESWKDTRQGLIDEVNTIPSDRFGFRATNETRTIAQLLQHVVETQKVFVAEICKPDTDFEMNRFPLLIRKYAAGVASVKEKNALIDLLRQSMYDAEMSIREFGEQRLNEKARRTDGREQTKLGILEYLVSHEMYHRGQITVYQRLLQIEPALTGRFKKLFTAAG